MDSVTQIALGAAVGEATLGHRVGRRALVWGGICGLLPDLDVLFPYGGPVKAFTYHRGPSHSLFVLAALTPLMVWVIGKCHPDTRSYRTRWYLLVFLAFVTSVFVDCITVYGTQAFWPISSPPIMWSTIFIIDPAYSLPLFFGVLAALIVSRKRAWGHRANTVCLVLTSAYLLWSVGAKLYVTHVARTSLERQDIAYTKLVTIPSPFNTLLWRVLAMDDAGYMEGYYSFFDDAPTVRIRHYGSNNTLLEDIESQWAVKRLQWFTHGFYSVRRMAGDVVIADLRMGMEPFYVFQFKVGKVDGPDARSVKAVTPERVRGQAGWNRLPWIWHRIWTAEPSMHPSTTHTAPPMAAGT